MILITLSKNEAKFIYVIVSACAQLYLDISGKKPKESYSFKFIESFLDSLSKQIDKLEGIESK